MPLSGAGKLKKIVAKVRVSGLHARISTGRDVVIVTMEESHACDVIKSQVPQAA
jgi:hypothetical protein